MASSSDHEEGSETGDYAYEREYESEGRRMRRMADRLDELEERVKEREEKERNSRKDKKRERKDKKRERKERKRKREERSSSEEEEEKERKRKSKGKKRRRAEDERREERLERARKREWKSKGHGEQFRVLDNALGPLTKARRKADKDGKEAIAAGIKEGEDVLHDRVKLLMFADNKGWSAARIYDGELECGSDTEDERRMRAATKEAAEVDKKKRPFQGGRGSTIPVPAATAGNDKLAGSSSKPAAAPAAAMLPGPVCWTCGQRGHMQRLCPQLQRAAGEQQQQQQQQHQQQLGR